MQIYPACSSFANVSLAILCWVTFSQVTRYAGSRSQAVGWCLLACASVLLINVTRISLIGFFPHYYDLLHGPIGTSVAGWLTLAASVAICAIGVKRGSAQRTATPEPAHA
jgi:exosortase/archaeosortase family protein